MTLKPEHIVEALNKTPELKRRLILRIMEELLDSEAFMEAYPRLYDPAAAEASPEYREKVREELAQMKAAWNVDETPYIEMSKKYNVDFRVYGYEMGLEFNREIEIVEGRLVTNRRIKFKDYKWECPDPTLGG